MKRLRPFALAFPGSVLEAAGALAAANGAARALAGGTDLLVDMKLGRARPSLVVDLRRVPGLDRIEEVEGGVRVGAMVPVATLESSALLRGGYHALWQAAGVLASPPVRRLATIGGNLGRASPASDLLPPLMVCGARAEIEGLGGARSVPVDELPIGPGATSLGAGELITAVLLPEPPLRTGTAHRKLGKRSSGWDLALVGVAAAVTLDEGGRVAAARIALASVGPTVLRAGEAERRLEGGVPTAELLEAAAQAAAAAARPIDDVRASASYRRALTRVLTRRVLAEAVGRAGRPAA